MAKLDTSSIEGFDTMTAEQKLEALLSAEIPESVDLSKYVLKDTFDKKASEASKWKKAHDALLTEDQQKKQAHDEEFEQMKTELEDLRKKTKVGSYKENLLKQGYDDALATETAEALFAGDMAKVFENGEKFKAALEKKYSADMMRGTPRPDGSGKGEPEEKESAAVQQAKRLGKARAESEKNARDVLKHYM